MGNQVVLRQIPSGFAKRHADWDQISQVSMYGRNSLDTISNFSLGRAATRAPVSHQARLLLAHLVGYLTEDQTAKPKCRFVVFPGNELLADELAYSTRTIQRLADELEANGLLRRCYNGMNRRVGFDLTPLAVRHREIQAKLIEVHTQKRQARRVDQMELNLAGAGIERPIAMSKMAPVDDAADTHNRSEKQYLADGALSEVLDQVALHHVSRSEGDKVTSPVEAQDTDTDREAAVLGELTGSGRAAHLGWVQAKRHLGFDRAHALFTIAKNDPSRRSTTDRYFGWLLRVALTGDGHMIIADAAKRVSKTRQQKGHASTHQHDGPTPSTLAPLPPECPSMATWRDAIAKYLDPNVFNAWMPHVSLSYEAGTLVLSTRSGFVRDYMRQHYGQLITHAARTAANGGDVKIIFRVAKPSLN